MSDRASRRLRLALVGGGPGSFIGPVHRMAAELDGEMRLVAGAFSRTSDGQRTGAESYGIDPARSYPDVHALIEGERQRADGAQVVAIATPNASHLAIARAALESGLAVVSDKPMTATLEEADELAAIVEQTGGFYVLTYTYTGYAMVREARAMVAAGAIGAVRKAVVEYPQGWLSAPIEHGGSRQAAWRVDPSLAGAGGCSGDIGVHAFNLLEFVTGLAVERLVADLSNTPGRMLDDDCNVLMRLTGEVPAVLHASQIAAGARNGLRLRVWGESGGLDWSHERPGELRIDRPDGSTTTLYAGAGLLSSAGRTASRLPPGHPEGFIEAFATIYRDAAAAIREGRQPDGELQGAAAGVRGMTFIDRAVQSSAEGRWVVFERAETKGPRS